MTSVISRWRLHVLVLIMWPSIQHHNCLSVPPLNGPGRQAGIDMHGMDMRRNEVIAYEKQVRLGFNPTLTGDELLVNDILLNYKRQEINRGLNDSAQFISGFHFFRVKEQIERSPVFQVIRRMPKGANLHGHNSAMVSSEWFVKNVTYRSDIIMYTTPWNVVRFSFKRPESGAWEYVRDLRARAASVESFDSYLDSLINLKTANPEKDYPDIDTVWRRFQNMFETIREAIGYLPVFIDFHRQLLQELSDDGVMYVEVRTGFAELYDNAGRTFSSMEVAKLWRHVIDEFKGRNPSFLGAKIIYTTSRGQQPTSLASDIEDFNKLVSAFPDLIIGFDIVGQEKWNNGYGNLVTALQALPKNTKLFFHAGETNWYGAAMDENLIDALLLNVTRIGHAYALVKHPVLWESVKRRRIGVEVSPISNQVLHLLADMRNHPAAFLLSENIPVVIGNDDPGFWDAKGLSYDFYYAFMAFLPIGAGIESLKKLVWTSMEQSVLTDEEWLLGQRMLQDQWATFLKQIIADHASRSLTN